MLLNTDLHLADIDNRMSRSEFVKNTLHTIKQNLEDKKLDHGANSSKSSANTDAPSSQAGQPSNHTSQEDGDERSGERSSVDMRKSKNRLSIRPTNPSRADSDSTIPDSAGGDNCNILVKSPYNRPLKGWEIQLEIVLKEFYNSIRQQRLPLHGASTGLAPEGSSNNLTVSSMLRRTPSVLSKAPSDSVSFRGRAMDSRSVGPRWNSKNRSRPRIYPSSTIGSSRTSLDDGSVWSPAGSSTWSKYSLGKTQASMMSVESFGSHFASGDYQQSIGFANALSQAIIREEGMSFVSDEFGKAVPLLEDETLELAGAPWAKEGILKHKHHLEAFDKKAKNREWSECFAVIEKGYMRLFSFNMNSRSLRHKARSRPSTAGVVGGGNWTENAENLGCFTLRHTIASALPPPGYSKNRPHVWALSLPTGAVHFFQVGTPEIVKEFVGTANYWAARLSKEPLVGGVSNIEYGWSENVINRDLIQSHSRHNSTGVAMPRPSMQSSIRSSIEQGTGVIKARLPGDKVTITDWTPPTYSMLPSQLMEVDQLRALQAYVQNLTEEHEKHAELRVPMLIAFSPRHPNCSKALANYDKKSAHLLREIVKYRTYIDSLINAQTRKCEVYEERGLNVDGTTKENIALKNHGKDIETPLDSPYQDAYSFIQTQ
jgi:hypothetical protein